MSESGRVETSTSGAFRWNTHGAFVVGVLGLSLWLQLAFPGVLAEGQFQDARAQLVLVYFAPLVLLVAAVLTRQASLLLLAFPVALLPGLAVLPSAERAALLGAGAMMRICATSTIYIALASAWVAARTSVEDPPTPVKGDHEKGRAYRRYVLGRTIPMLLIFIVPAGAALFDPAVVSTISQNYPDGEFVAQTFIVLLTLFFWAVVAYTLFLMPALNLEYDRRRVRRGLDEIRTAAAAKTRVLRLGIELGIVWTLVGGFLLLAN